jgi:hypothetical protein
MGNSLVLTNGDSTGMSVSKGHSINGSVGGQISTGLTISHKQAIIPRTREEWHPSGRLRRSVDDQFHWWMQQIHGLQTGEAILLVRERAACTQGRDPGMALLIQIARVEEWWTCAEDKWTAIERIKNRLTDLHAYLYVPDLGIDAQEKRLEGFLMEAPAKIDPLPKAAQDDDRHGLI